MCKNKENHLPFSTHFSAHFCQKWKQSTNCIFFLTKKTDPFRISRISICPKKLHECKFNLLHEWKKNNNKCSWDVWTKKYWKKMPFKIPQISIVVCICRCWTLMNMFYVVHVHNWSYSIFGFFCIKLINTYLFTTIIVKVSIDKKDVLFIFHFKFTTKNLLASNLAWINFLDYFIVKIECQN